MVVWKISVPLIHPNLSVHIGYVTQLGKDWFELGTNVEASPMVMANYMHKREVVGLQANVVRA